jgi:hypothetical protein
MELKPRENQFKSGLWFCWIAVLLLPLGLLAIGSGPCAGPRDAAGSTILLGGGVGCLILAVSGIFRVLREIRAAGNPMRALGAVSVCCAGFAGFVGGFYLLMGIISLGAFLKY